MDKTLNPRIGAESAARGRILLVEDSPDAALFITHVLGARGRFDVSHTADPVVALSKAASGALDLVVTDLDLPVMSGLELTAALRALVPGLPVVVITSRSRETWPEFPPGELQPDAILARPVPADDLLAIARTLVGRPTQSPPGR